MSEKTSDHAGNKLVKSALWCVSARWVVKIFGLISTYIMVRLLAPEDFGIVMKAFIIFGIFDVFMETKFSPALVRIKNPSKTDYDTAFTLNLLLGIILFIGVNGLAFVSDIIMQDQDIPFLVHVLSLRFLFNMIESPRIMDLQKNLNFEKDFYYLVSHKLFSIICAVALCYYYQNYMGLLFAYITNAMGLALLSYLYMPYRPCLTLQNKAVFFKFSFPSMRGNFLAFMSRAIDRILPSRYISNKAMGIYNFAYELAFQLTTEIVYPLSRALFPIFSDIEGDKKNVSQHYHYVQQFLFALCSALGVGLFLVAEDLIALYAGEKWMEAVPFFKIFSLVGASYVFKQVHCSIFEGTGHVRTKEKLILAQFIVTVLAMIPFIIDINLYYLALVQLAVNCLFALIYVGLSIKFYDIAIKPLLIFYIRTVISLSVMVFTYDIMPDYIILQILGCMVTFIICQFGIWGISRNSNMIEAKLLNLAYARLKQ